MKIQVNKTNQNKNKKKKKEDQEEKGFIPQINQVLNLQ